MPQSLNPFPMLTACEQYCNIHFSLQLSVKQPVTFAAMQTDRDNSNWMYMLRTTQQHHVQLSLLADQKANILIASNSIILSLTLSRLEVLQGYWCTYSMVAMSIVSIVLALFVVAPLSLPKRRPKLKEEQFNSLFFDHFSQLSHEEYQAHMSEIMETPEQVQRAMVKDIYQIGRVLQTRKYPFLKFSSLVFVVGVLLSIVFLAAQFSMS